LEFLNNFLSLAVEPTTMLKLILNNRFYFFCILIFILAGAILLSLIEYGDGLIFFSQHRSNATNWFFIIATQLDEHFAYIICLAILLFKSFRLTLMIPLIGLIVTLLSLALKVYFAYDRPGIYFKDLLEAGEIIVVEGFRLNLGASSFPSGHTMSAFALYSFMAFVFAPNKKWAFLFFSLALLVGVSRTYLFQHFLIDVYVGALIGVLVAMIIYVLQDRIPKSEESWINRSLPLKKKQVA